MAQSLAAEVPVELFDLVLSFYTAQDLDDAQLERNYVKTEKRQIAPIALVCRAWARACQPKLFEELELRSREDLEQLLSLMAHPKTRIRDYIWFIKCRIKVTDPSTPWIYLAYLQLIPKVTSSRQLRTLHVCIDGLSAQDQYQSIRKQLFLRPLPASVTRMSNLTLTDLHFKHFRDLIKLIMAYPSLTYVECKKITWDPIKDSDMPTPKSSLSRCSPFQRQYSMQECTDIGAAVWLPLFLLQNKDHTLRARDAHIMRRVASALTQGLNDNPHSDLYVMSYTNKEGAMHFYAMSQDGSRRYMRPYTYIYLTQRFEDGMQQIQTIVLDFSPNRTTLPLQDLVDYVDWTTLDEQLCLLRNIRTVLFVFESPMALQSINESIIQPKLPHLGCSARLKYAISNEKAYSERRWLECTPETIDQDVAGAAWKMLWREIY